jgi:Icc-related predicted phosphoesterase
MRLDKRIASLSNAALLVWLVAFGGASSAEETLRVAVISDLNGSYGSTDYAREVARAVERIIDLRPDLVISTGDMVAGQRRPHLSRSEVEAMWSSFHAQVSEPIKAAGIPLAVTPGNHDASAYSGFVLERDIYATQWSERRPTVRFVDEAGYPFHYAFALGDVLFVSVDATVVGRLPKAQMDWLGELLTTEGPRYRYRVLFSHVPLWPFALGRIAETIGDPKLQALLETTDVDLYLSGHHHAFYPGSRGGVAFVGQACLGSGPRRLVSTNRRSAKALTMATFGEKEIGLAAFKAPHYVETIPWKTLPQSITTDAGTLQRADTAGVLTEIEQLP